MHAELTLKWLCVRRFDHLLDSGAQCRVVEETFYSVLQVAGVLKVRTLMDWRFSSICLFAMSKVPLMEHRTPSHYCLTMFLEQAYYISPSFQGTASIPPWDWESSLVVSAPPKNSSLAGENSSFVKSKPRPLDERGDFASAAFYFVADQVVAPLLGGDSMDDANRAFAYFFTMDTRNVPSDAITAGNLIRNSMVCDFEAVTFCKKKDGTR